MEYIKLKSKVKNGFYLLYPKIDINWFKEQKASLRAYMSQVQNVKSASFLASDFFNIKYVHINEKNSFDKLFLDENKGDAMFLNGFKMHLQPHDFYFTIDWSRTTDVLVDSQEIIIEKEYVHKNENKRFKLELDLDLCTALDHDDVFDEIEDIFDSDWFAERIQKAISESDSQVLRISLENCEFAQALN